MKNLFKNLFVLFASLFILSVPAYAETVELQSESPLYTVKENCILTDEEQSFLDYVISYFTAYPEATTLTLTTKDFADISGTWANNVFEKIEWNTSHYAINENDVYAANWHLILYPIYATYEQGYTGDLTVVITNYDFDQVLRLKQFLDYTYSLLPSIGVTDGMNEKDAIAILNKWECDFLTKKESSWTRYETIYEHRGGLCCDYAYFFKALCEGAGIEAYTLTSDDHAWNEVITDGQSYEIDVYWNDLDTVQDIYMLTRAQCSKIPHHTVINYKD